ncbi:sensor histidine kinase [Rhodococcus opacus]|uniref:sensor histidine kinase n=1 Tax=Rhodococcus opacus TaxID=37919 RepID=UPI00155AF5B4|nr:ATP-binding protein [Rhodococcus opacus]
MTSHRDRPRTLGADPVRSRGPGLGVRLLLAQSLVLVAGAATCWVVAVFAGPPLFREHLHRAGVPASSDEQFHAEQAYRSATAISLAVALGVASLAALVVTWYFSRRLQRSVTEVASAATAVADGRYDIRVTSPHLGEDFDALAEAFNRMAAGLESVETTRRQLLGDLAHEIRTPVSVLEAYMEALEDGVETLDADTITMLRDQTRRLVRFSDDVNALSHAEESRTSIEPTWVDPAALLSTTLTAATDRYAAKEVALTSRVPAHLPRLWADPQRLGQVLGNLLDNALRHTPGGGRVEVTAGQRHELLVIEVTDTGDGIAAEHLPHLFERFYRVDAARDREHGGAGIGLAIAKALVEAQRGHITARSDGPGTGSTFTITLPLRRDQRRGNTW